ncbi:hypothetical protein [Stenotrophomonas maltophilia]|uniref:hypothetical protein n=1 Tax=Stenotrophomonas maltophilia TaxID=40324 RepID=UPI001F45A0AC|nr:hypothetical protein [Stenotrophomonas maltophilia]
MRRHRQHQVAALIRGRVAVLIRAAVLTPVAVALIRVVGLIRVVAVAPIRVAVVALIPSPSPALRVARMPMGTHARGRAVVLILVVAQIPAMAAVAVLAAVLVRSHLCAVAMRSSAHSFSSNGALAVRLKGWVARSRVIRRIAKPHTSAKATRLPAVSSL